MNWELWNARANTPPLPESWSYRRRCPYCGRRCRGRWTCAYCADLPALDPHHPLYRLEASA